MAEFAANNAVNTSTQVTPFFANKGFHPRMSFGPPREILRSSSKSLRKQITAGNDFASKMAEILEILRSNLTCARDKQENASVSNRSPAPAYRVGDEVFLDTRNITTSRPIEKLDCKFIGPFRVIKIINSHAYKLQLPFEYEKLHNVFHTSLLRPAPTNPLPGQVNPPPPPIALDESGEKLYAIEAILDSKRGKNKKNFQYLILWRGYDSENQTWEPLKNVVNASASIKEFERRFPHKIKPSSSEIERARNLATKSTSLIPLNNS